MSEPTFKRLFVKSFLNKSGRKIRIAPKTKTKTVTGSKTKAIPNPKKYKRKKRGELIESVEKIRRNTSVFKIKIPHGPSPPKDINPLPFFLAEIRMYAATKTPKIGTVASERGVSCQISIRIKETISTKD